LPHLQQQPPQHVDSASTQDITAAEKPNLHEMVHCCLQGSTVLMKRAQNLQTHNREVLQGSHGKVSM
jgi:hypothetical protein